jgi:hypothetical protein
MGGNHLRRAQPIDGVWLLFPRSAQSVSSSDSGILEPCKRAWGESWELDVSTFDKLKGL